jgi:hypothetical protein
MPDAEVRQLVEHALREPDQPGFTPPAVYKGNGGPPAAQSEAQLPAATGLVTLNVEQLLQRQAEPREFIIEPILREKVLLTIRSGPL